MLANTTEEEWKLYFDSKSNGAFLSSISSLTEKELSSASRDVTTSCQKGVSMKDKMSFGQI